MRDRAGDEKDASREDQVIRAGDTNPGKRVVIVDDEENLVNMFAKMIPRRGHKLEMAAGDGSEIVSAIAANNTTRRHPDGL
jgi:hypothetical protein